MFNAGTLSFREFMMREALPLAIIQEAVLEFLRERDDVVLFGAQAVNAYVDEPRMTQDIDLLSTRAEGLADELREYLSDRFQIAVRAVAGGRGLRLYQVQKTGNRHLVDVRRVDALPAAQRIAQVLVMAPADLIASKVVSYAQRQGQPKSGTDWRDLAMLLLAFPGLKQEAGEVLERLHVSGANAKAIALWKELVAEDFRPTDEEEGY